MTPTLNEKVEELRKPLEKQEKERDPGREAWTGPGLFLCPVFPMVLLVFLHFFIQFGSHDGLES